MLQIRDFADDRLVSGCIYCGGRDDTREHVPSRAFLDAPYPENLPVVGACQPCNAGFSSDEEYLACLLEAVVAGSTDPASIRRSKIAKSLEHSPTLRSRIDAARTTTESGTTFQPEVERVARVLTKLAVGHAAYELAQSRLGSPSRIWWHPIDQLNPAERGAFEAPDVTSVYGELGSRGMQRLVMAQLPTTTESGQLAIMDVMLNDWIEVQPGRYRYHTSDDGESVCVRMVIADYLAVEIDWEY